MTTWKERIDALLETYLLSAPRDRDAVRDELVRIAHLSDGVNFRTSTFLGQPVADKVSQRFKDKLIAANISFHSTSPDTITTLEPIKYAKLEAIWGKTVQDVLHDEEWVRALAG